LFWFVLGLLFVLIAAGAKMWAEDLKLKMTWWKWALVALWYGMLNFTLAVPFTFIGENESGAAVYLLLFLGVVTLILGVGLFSFLWSQREKAGVMKQEAEAVS
jgi:heme/copper-type cytochrome/quinol oxidase subunit 2